MSVLQHRSCLVGGTNLNCESQARPQVVQPRVNAHEELLIFEILSQWINQHANSISNQKKFPLCVCMCNACIAVQC